MSIQKQWHDGVQEVTGAFLCLSETALQRLRALSSQLMRQKRAMQAYASRVDSASRCAACGGACCRSGKYHFSEVDLLVYLAAGRPLFAPLFDNLLCPYLGEGGCFMEPALRPFNCITFNCELIEELLSREEVASFYRLERELRCCYLEISSLFTGSPLSRALLKGMEVA